MFESVQISDFDILGVIKLQDVKGIEKYVTPIIENSSCGKPTMYLSRSSEYYNVKSLTELSKQREELKRHLTRDRSKRNFVILENMLNCSAKVYYKKLEEYVSDPSVLNKCYLEISRLCLIEDCKNLITILSNKGLIECTRQLILPQGPENCPKRPIEMDNKAILYIFSKYLDLGQDKDNIHVVTPGYGSVFIGPFLNVLYGYDFTNIYKSKYITETLGNGKSEDMRRIVSNDRLFGREKRVVLLDDNIGTGTTIKELKHQLESNGVECHKCGAVQYNWRNYYRVLTGEKKGIPKFDINEIDIITPFNYAGHKMYTHAIDMLNESGKNYVEYLKSKSYGTYVNDTIGSIKRGLVAATKSGVRISKFKYEGPMNSDDREGMEHPIVEPAPISEGKMKWIDGIISYAKGLTRETSMIQEELFSERA